MKQELKFIVEYKGKRYEFDYGVDAFVFHTGIYGGIADESLENYVKVVTNAYLSDYNRTPIGELGDWVAENYDDVKTLDKHELLSRFYAEGY